MYSRVVVNEGPTNHPCGSQGEKTNKKEREVCMEYMLRYVSLARMEKGRQKGDERNCPSSSLRRYGERRFAKRAARFTLVPANCLAHFCELPKRKCVSKACIRISVWHYIRPPAHLICSCVRPI